MSDEKHHEIERWMAKRLGEVLERPADEFGPLTRFDTIGLDSVSEAGLAMEIEKRFNVRAKPSAFMRHPTIGEIAKYLCRKTGA